MNEQEFDGLFRSKLNSLTQVPDAPWDDEAVWGKLEPVLRKGNNRMGYFLIILVLLLAGLSGWYFLQQQKFINTPISGINQRTATTPKITKRLPANKPQAIQRIVPKQTQSLFNKPLITRKQPTIAVKPIALEPIKVVTRVKKEAATNLLPQKLTLVKESNGYLEPRKSAGKSLVGINFDLNFEKTYLKSFNEKGTFYYGIGLKNTFTPAANSETSLLSRRQSVNMFVAYRYAPSDNNLSFILRSGVVQSLPFASAQTTTFLRPAWETQGRFLIKLWENKPKTNSTFFFIDTPPMRLHVKPSR